MRRSESTTGGVSRGGRVQYARYLEAAVRGEGVVPPRGRVEDDFLSGRQAEPPADLRGEQVSLRVSWQVGGGIAGRDDLAVEAERVPEDRWGERVLGQQHVPAGGVLPDQVGIDQAAGELRPPDVKADALERRSVPGLQADLMVSFSEPGGRQIVGDHV